MPTPDFFLSVDVLNPVKRLSIAYLTQVSLGRSQIRMTENNLADYLQWSTSS